MVSKENHEKLKQTYQKVFAAKPPYIKKGFIKCPACGEEILIVPTLRKMNEAIENHVQQHKAETSANLLQKHAKPMGVRLALAEQILQTIQN